MKGLEIIYIYIEQQMYFVFVRNKIINILSAVV